MRIRKMPRYKPAQRNGLFIAVVLDEQIQPGTFEFALVHLVDEELDLSALDAKFRNDDVGASAYDPRAMLKIVLLAYSRGLITSRKIERACEQNVLFMAVSGDARPSYTHIARFVRELGPGIAALFGQVLMTCDRLGLIGKTMFAIDGVKLPANASKERSGTHAELAHRADRLARAAAKIVALHRAQDEHGAPLDSQRQTRIDELRREAQATRDFIARAPKRLNAKGAELKTNVTDPDSAKMATAKGVIQGYAAQAAVDSAHQVIVAADVIGSGSEQAMLLPMIDKTTTRARQCATPSIQRRAERCTADASPPWSRCLPTSATTRACAASRCAARPRSQRSGSCTAWCTTSRRSPPRRCERAEGAAQRCCTAAKHALTRHAASRFNSYASTRPLAPHESIWLPISTRQRSRLRKSG
jgi:transposase